MPLTVSVPGQRAAPSVLDHVAEAIDRRRLADDAIVDALARDAASFSTTLAVPSIDGPSSSDVRRSAIEPGASRMRRDERLDRRDERRERALHVGGTAAVQPAVALGRHERIRLPLPRADRSARRRCGRRRQTSGRASPRRSQPLRTPFDSSVSVRNPSGARRDAMSSWQPASSGVSDRRSISARVSARVSA